MSASYVIDLGNTVQAVPSVQAAIASTLSGVVIGGVASGVTVGNIIDLKDSDALCNIWLVAGPGGSGPLGIQVQTAPAGSGVFQSGGGFPVSGAFTDPTSGLAQLPSKFVSGGIVWFNSGLYAQPGGGGASGGMNVNTFPFGAHSVKDAQGGTGFVASGALNVFCSGGIGFASFQRPHRFARLILMSGATADFINVQAGFLSQLRTTGSGGGFTFSPGSGTVNV